MYLDDRKEVLPEVPLEKAPTKPYPEPWQQTLLEAAQVMENRGWCTSSEEDEKGRVCLLGALRISKDGIKDEGYWDARRALRAYLNYEIDVWNDAWCQSKRTAITVLEKAANY